MDSFKPQECGGISIHERNDKAGQLTRPNLHNQEPSPLRQSPASSFAPTHGTSLLGTPKSNAQQLYFPSQIIRPRVEQSNSSTISNRFAMSTPLSMSMSTVPKQQRHDVSVSVSHPSHYAGAGYALHPQPQCRHYAFHHDHYPSQRRRIAGYRQGPFPSPQPLQAANIHDEQKGAFASRGNKKVDDSDKEVEEIMSKETPWNQSPHEYIPSHSHLPAPCHLPHPQPHQPYYYDQYQHQHQHHYPIHPSNFYASHPYSSYYHPNPNVQQYPRYRPIPSPHPNPHTHPHSHMRQRKRKYRHSRKEFIINVDRSLSPALSDITASPTPSMDEFDNDNYDNNNNNAAAAAAAADEKEKYNKSFKSMLQPLLECHKTTDVTVTQAQLRIDTSSPSSDNLNVNMDPPRIERKSSSSSKKQTTFDWDIDINIDNDNVVRTVSPIKSSPRKENIISRRGDHSHSKSNSNPNHLSKRKKVWRQIKSQDDASQRFLIANNISQSSSSLWDAHEA